MSRWRVWWRWATEQVWWLAVQVGLITPGERGDKQRKRR